MAGKAQKEYLQQRSLQLKAAAEQEEAIRRKKTFLETHREDVQSLAVHACLLVLVLLGVFLPVTSSAASFLP